MLARTRHQVAPQVRAQWRAQDAGFTMPVMGGDSAGGVAVRLLGPVEIGPASGATAPVSQPRLRVLLGLLAVAAGRMVSADALVDGLWGEEWSPGRERNLHALVYQVRQRLTALEPGRGPGRGGARLVRGGGGYRCGMNPRARARGLDREQRSSVNSTYHRLAMD